MFFVVTLMGIISHAFVLSHDADPAFAHREQLFLWRGEFASDTFFATTAQVLPGARTA